MENLTEEEQLIIQRSGDLAITKQRTVMVAITGVLALAALAYFAFTVGSVKHLFAVSALYVVITIFEKVSYGNGVLLYKNVINKLHARVQELENSVDRQVDRRPGSDHV